MATLSLPIQSPVPLDTLRQSIKKLVERPIEGSQWWTRNTSTRVTKRCDERGINFLWILAILPRIRFFKLKNAGEKTTNLAEEILVDAGCTFDMFPDFRSVLDGVAARANETSGHSWISCFEVLMALAGIGAWVEHRAIIAALAEVGLRPGMSIEELFVHIPPEGEQEPAPIGPEEPLAPLTSEERAALLLFLDEHGLLGAARDSFSPDLCRKLGIRNG